MEDVMKTVTLGLAVLLAAATAFAQSAPPKIACHDLASAGNYVAPDETIVNGMACKVVSATAAPAPQPLAPAPVAPAPAVQPESAAMSGPAPIHNGPYLYISGTGNTSTRGTFVGGQHFATGEVTSDQRDQTIELAQDFSKECTGVKLTMNQQDADYTVNLNHQAFHGLAHKNDQIMVTNRAGEVVNAKSTHSVTGAVKGACETVLADFGSNKHEQSAIVAVAAK
jgi:hypothetical protein